jgi:hypothetical protein
MIDRRTSTFASLLVAVSRCFAQEKTPTRQIVKGEDSGIRMFSSEDLYRIEYLQERKVIIGNQNWTKFVFST